MGWPILIRWLWWSYDYDCIIIEMEKHKKELMLTLEEQSNVIFNRYIYEESGLKPCSCFWKELVLISRETPRVLIPDTLIINDK